MGGWNPLNDLQYEFGGGRATTDAARSGTLDPTSTDPSFVERYIFGTTKEDKDKARYQGEVQRFRESDLSDQADMYGIEVKDTGSGKLNRSAIGQKVLDAKELKSNKSLLKGMGYTGDLSGVTENNAVLGLIKNQRITNEADADARSFNSLGNKDERRIRDERYADSRTDVANQMELTRAQMAQSDKRYLADRIDAREARADDLMFRRESMERADRKDDKNRRRESIQALVAGLSSLGAAFAV
jgi:hypothetical protein